MIPVDPNQAVAINFGSQGSFNHGNQGGSPYGSPYGGGYPQGGVPYGGGQPYNSYPSNQGYQYTQVTANPYTPPNSNYYNPSQNSPTFQRNYGDNTYNPRMQSNYINRTGSAPADL